jgi:hypothetical protein
MATPRTVAQIIAQGAQMGLHDIGPNFGAAAVAASNAGFNGSPPGEAALIEASLRLRGFPYWKNQIGDCPLPTSKTSGVGAQLGIQSTQIASTAGLTALETAGILSGPATLGIGAAVGFAIAGVEDLLQHHSVAVANEQNTLCFITGNMNATIPKIDAAVASGLITPDEGTSLIKQLVQQMRPALQTIEQVCNAACVYSGVLNGHVAFAPVYYKQIAPMRVIAQSPGAAPTAFGSNPGGVPATIQFPQPPVPPRALQVNPPSPLPTQPKAQTNYVLAPSPLSIPIPLSQGAGVGASAGLSTSAPMILLIAAGAVLIFIVAK